MISLLNPKHILTTSLIALTASLLSGQAGATEKSDAFQEDAKTRVRKVKWGKEVFFSLHDPRLKSLKSLSSEKKASFLSLTPNGNTPASSIVGNENSNNTNNDNTVFASTTHSRTPLLSLLNNQDMNDTTPNGNHTEITPLSSISAPSSLDYSISDVENGHSHNDDTVSASPTPPTTSLSSLSSSPLSSTEDAQKDNETSEAPSEFSSSSSKQQPTETDNTVKVPSARKAIAKKPKLQKQATEADAKNNKRPNQNGPKSHIARYHSDNHFERHDSDKYWPGYSHSSSRELTLDSRTKSKR